MNVTRHMHFVLFFPALLLWSAASLCGEAAENRTTGGVGKDNDPYKDRVRSDSPLKFPKRVTYHVWPDKAGASDDNPGTLQRPWKTLAHAGRAVKTNQTVIIHPGIYRESLVIRAGGGPAMEGTIGSYPVRFLATEAGKVVISGADVVTRFVPDKDAPADQRGKVWVKRPWPVNSQGVYVDGKPLRQIGNIDMLIPENKKKLATGGWSKPMWKTDLPPGQHLTSRYNPYLLAAEPGGRERMCPRSFHYDRATKSLYVWLEDGSDPNRHLVEAGARSVGIRAEKGVARVELYGITVTHVDALDNMGCSAIVAGEHFYLRRCTAEWNTSNGITLGRGSMAFECKANFNGFTGFTGGADIRIDHCQANHNNWRGYHHWWGGGGMKLAVWDRIKVTHCETAHNFGDGIWFDCWGSYHQVIANHSHHNERKGIEYEISRWGFIANNIVDHNGGSGITLSDAQGTWVVNNLCHANRMGISIRGGTPKTIRLDPKQMHGRKARDAKVDMNRPTDIRVYNNIVVDNRDGEIETLDPADERYVIAFNSNIYYASGRGFRAFNRGTRRWISSLEKWRAASSDDLRSIWADPRWVDAKAGDYRLTESSAAIGAGILFERVLVDYLGRARPSAKGPCIGPFTWTGTEK